MTIKKRLLSPLALCLAGAALALGACGDDDEDTDVTAVDQDTTIVTDSDATTENTVTGGGPASEAPTPAACIELWNGANNATNRTLLAGKTDPGDDSVINASVNTATDPATCVVTVVTGDMATEWAEAAGQDFPYATPNELDASELEQERRVDNADADATGKLKAAG